MAGVRSARGWVGPGRRFLKGPELLAARVRLPEWWAQLRAWWGKFLPTTAGWFLGLALELGADAP